MQKGRTIKLLDYQAVGLSIHIPYSHVHSLKPFYGNKLALVTIHSFGACEVPVYL